MTDKSLRSQEDCGLLAAAAAGYRPEKKHEKKEREMTEKPVEPKQRFS